MIDREEQFDGPAAEHARLRAVYDAEADRIANEIIDKWLAEEPEDARLAARRDEAHERELMAAADLNRGEAGRRNRLAARESGAR